MNPLRLTGRLPEPQGAMRRMATGYIDLPAPWTCLHGIYHTIPCDQCYREAELFDPPKMLWNPATNTAVTDKRSVFYAPPA